MISKITGKVVGKGLNYLCVEMGGFCYDVLIPSCVMQRIEPAIGPENQISLVTFHYYQVEPSKSIPVLIGFLNQVEKDFFEIFITVSGIGPRAALKALNKPISLIAAAIDQGDLVFLKSLPGIGQQRAKEIIAKLQNKVGKFGLLQDRRQRSGAFDKDIADDALAVLLQLEYKRQEAAEMIKKVLDADESIKTTEELLNSVYKQRCLK